jgi:hypothetical protein
VKPTPVIAFQWEDMDDLSAQLGAVLGVEFEPRESLYRGGAYDFGQLGKTKLYVQKNWDLVGDEPFEAQYAPDCLLLYLESLEDVYRIEVSIREHFKECVI